MAEEIKSQHFKQRDLRNLGPMDTDLPVGSRAGQDIDIELPDTGQTFSYRKTQDPLDQSKSLSQTYLGLEPVKGDPNSVEPHTDVIRVRLLKAMEDPNSSPEDRQSAKTLFTQLYPASAELARQTDIQRRGI